MKGRARYLFLVAMAALFVMPIIITVTSSFMSPGELNKVYGGGSIRLVPRQATLDAYGDILFSGGAYLRMFWNSILLALVIALGETFVGLIVGYAITKVRFRGGEIMRFLYILVMMMPFQVTLLPNYIIIKRLGLYNTHWALIIPAIFAPMGVFLMSQYMRRMPADEIEAAMMDTNSPLRLLVHIVVPKVRHALVAFFLLGFAEAWNMVEQPLIMLTDETLYPLSLVLNSSKTVNSSIAFAGSTLYILPIVFLYFMFDESLIDGLGLTRF